MDPLYALRLEADPVTRVQIDWPPGRLLLDCVLFSTASLGESVDELRSADPVEVHGLDPATVEFSQVGRGSLWDRRRAVLRSYPDRLEYWIELMGRGALDRIALFEAIVADAGVSGWRKVLPWPRSGQAAAMPHRSRGRFSTVFRPPRGAAPGEHLPSNRYLAVEPADAGEAGGAGAGSRQLVLGLGEVGRWVMLGLRVDQHSKAVTELEYQGGQTWGLGLSYPDPIDVRGVWRSPVLVLLPVRSESEGLAAYDRWLEQSGPSQP